MAAPPEAASSEEIRGIRPIRARRPVPGAAAERRPIKVQPEFVDPSIARGRPGGVAVDVEGVPREPAGGARPLRSEQTTRNLKMPSGLSSRAGQGDDADRSEAARPDRRAADTRRVKFTESSMGPEDSEENLEDLLKGYLGPKKQE